MFHVSGLGTPLRLLLIILLAITVAPIPRWHPVSALAGGQQRSFQALGPMPGSVQEGPTFASGISANGSTVIGEAAVCPGGSTTCTSTGKSEAYCWTVAGEYQLLGGLNGSFGSSPGASGSGACATSANGSQVVGQSPQGSNVFGAFLWTTAQGMQPLPMQPMQTASAVSANGTMIVGGNGWFNTSSHKSGTFGTFPGQGDTATALGVSGDGQIVGGFAFNGSNEGRPTNNADQHTNCPGIYRCRHHGFASQLKRGSQIAG